MDVRQIYIWLTSLVWGSLYLQPSMPLFSTYTKKSNWSYTIHARNHTDSTCIFQGGYTRVHNIYEYTLDLRRELSPKWGWADILSGSSFARVWYMYRMPVHRCMDWVHAGWQHYNFSKYHNNIMSLIFFKYPSFTECNNDNIYTLVPRSRLRLALRVHRRTSAWKSNNSLLA